MCVSFLLLFFFYTSLTSGWVTCLLGVPVFQFAQSTFSSAPHCEYYFGCGFLKTLSSLLATQVSVKPAVSTGWVQEGPWLYEAPCFQAFRLFHLIYFKTHLICRLSCRKKKPSLHLTSWIYFSPSSVFLVSKTVDTVWVLEVPLVTRIAPWFHEWGTCGFERVHFWADTGCGKLTGPYSEQNKTEDFLI